MRNLFIRLFGKNSRIGTLQLVYIVSEYMAIMLFSIIILFGIGRFGVGIWHFFLDDDKGEKTETFIENLLNVFELFFLSPIPLLIIASFKSTIIKMYPIDVKVHPTVISDMIKELDAKKTFISSLIGVTSTIILGQIIEGLTPAKRGDAVYGFSASSGYFIMLILAIIFLVIQIVLYFILASHQSKEKP